jgi:hypothetical protein
VVREAAGDVASLSADATQVITVRNPPPRRPDVRTATSPSLPIDEEPSAVAEEEDSEATAPFVMPGTEATAPLSTQDATATRPVPAHGDDGAAPVGTPPRQAAEVRPPDPGRAPRTDPNEATQVHRFEEDE